MSGWDVVCKLGEGSFGGVYEIQRTLPDSTIERAALKKLTIPKDQTEITELYAQNFDSDSITAYFKEQMQNLVREYAFMQKLGENPNVVHCQDLRTVQHDDGIGWDIYIRMELLKPLKTWLTDRYDERQVIRLGLNMCGALHGCHQRNIIHRDIKPENILVTEDGKFKLGDFGIAKVSDKTATGTLAGTYSYMAPEIANRQHYGTSADIYSLGLVMYWMMNERTLPFLPLGKKIPSGVQRQEAQNRRFSGEEIPAPINGSQELTRIVLKACAYSLEDRYHSVQELAEDLQRYYEKIPENEVYFSRSKYIHNGQLPKERQEEPTVQSNPLDIFTRVQETVKHKKLLRMLTLCTGFVIALALAIGGWRIWEHLFSSPFTYKSNNTGITITGYNKEPPLVLDIPEKINEQPVTEIGDRAFEGSSTIRSVTIPESVTSIGDRAFWKCENLSDVIINQYCVVGNNTFPSTCHIMMPFDLKYEKDEEGVIITGYSGELPENVRIPSEINGQLVTGIGEEAFIDSANLRIIFIPNTVRVVGDSAFENCTDLRNVTLPEGITSIGRRAFARCCSLNSITLPDSITTIGDAAFSDCVKLSSIIIPSGVSSIADAVFSGCTKLSRVSFPAGLSRIGEVAFSECISLDSVVVGSKCDVDVNAFPSTCQVQRYH